MRIILLSFLIIFGCSRDDSEYINSYRVPKSQVILEESNQNCNSFDWDTPENWLVINNNQFSNAKYLIPSNKGGSELSVTYASGSIKDNVNRWRGQLNLEKLNSEEIESMAEYYSSNIAENHQVYTIINPENSKRAFLCSIISANNTTIFIKLDTYSEIIDNLKEQFIEFASSFRCNE